MRTSRISRETIQVLNALSSESRRSTRRSLQSFANGGDGDHNGSPANKHSAEVDRDSAISTSLGKRKRADLETPMKTGAQFEATTVRRSPRKAEDGIGEDARPRKPRLQPAKRIKGSNGDVTTEPPGNWETVYNVTAAMRKRVLAPVDTMGCESLAETHRSPKDQRLQTLVSLMMSSQTKDTVTAAAMKNLQTNLPGGFCLDSLLKVEPEQLNRLIEKVGFHNNKTKFIKAVAVILRDQYEGDIPDTIAGLVSLPGVGPKMAYLCTILMGKSLQVS
jgi:endonuclease III